MEKKMRILVVEDSPLHQESARQLLGADYDIKIISDPTDFKDEITETVYDAVLLDLLMPVEKDWWGKHFMGQQMSFGMFLLWIAVQQNVPMVGILTDADHHKEPASGMLDYIIKAEDNVMNFQNSKVVIARELFTKITFQGKEQRGKNWLKLLKVLTGESQECDPKYEMQKSFLFCFIKISAIITQWIITPF